MPYKEKPIEKKYWTIGEVAKHIGEATSVLRFWESEFPMLKPKKNSNDNRIYSAKDFEIILKIHYLVKTKGYTLWGARKVLEADIPKVDLTKEQLIDLIKEIYLDPETKIGEQMLGVLEDHKIIAK